MTLSSEMLPISMLRAWSHLGGLWLLFVGSKALAARIQNCNFTAVKSWTCDRLLVASCKCRKMESHEPCKGSVFCLCIPELPGSCSPEEKVRCRYLEGWNRIIRGRWIKTKKERVGREIKEQKR